MFADVGSKNPFLDNQTGCPSVAAYSTYEHMRKSGSDQATNTQVSWGDNRASSREEPLAM